MTAFTFSGVVSGRLVKLDARFESGLSAILLDPLRASVELVELAAGVTRVKQGQVRIDGRDPFRAPDVRRRVASLLDVEESVVGDTVEAGLARSLVRRGSSKTARDVLGSAGFGAWGARHPSSLSPDENRSVALSIALSVERPLVAALVEPLSSGVNRRFVVSTVSEWARRGTVVVCVVSSLRDAEELGAHPLSFERGPPSRVIVGQVGRDVGLALELVVRVDDPQRLAQGLAGDDAVASVRWDTARDPFEVVVRGPDVERASLAVLRAAEESGVRVTSLEGRASAPEIGRSRPEAPAGIKP